LSDCLLESGPICCSHLLGGVVALEYLCGLFLGDFRLVARGRVGLRRRIMSLHFCVNFVALDVMVFDAVVLDAVVLDVLVAIGVA
jgi:hypothetical protein